jgi:hypothetical protein
MPSLVNPRVIPREARVIAGDARNTSVRSSFRHPNPDHVCTAASKEETTALPASISNACIWGRERLWRRAG